jgi:hypothetical protein
MRRILCGVLLVFGMLAFAQQQYPSNPPPPGLGSICGKGVSFGG